MLWPLSDSDEQRRLARNVISTLANLNHHQITLLLLSIGVLLVTARLLGEFVQRFRQPAVLGEILAGILLGSTVLGRFAPDLKNLLFPSTGSLAVALQGLTTVAIVLFMFVAGLEVDLSSVWRQGRSALNVSASGMVFPFVVGFAGGWVVPGWLGAEAGTDRWVFALFFATALSITALPVVIKTLRDLNLFRSDFGMIVVSAAMLDDLLGWIIFAIILGMIGRSGIDGATLWHTVMLTLAFVTFMLTIGRWLCNRMLPLLQAHACWPGGVLGFSLAASLLCAALTEWIGIHAIFGAFLFGVALGDSVHLREHTRTILEQFISFIFAPLFFASIGLQINFIDKFDPVVVGSVLVIATIGKVVGCGFGARWSKIPKRESLAIGVAMNARGAMEIILGLLAFQAGIIRERMLVALVIMALVTSMMSGAFLRKILRRPQSSRLVNHINARYFRRSLVAGDSRAAIHELCSIVCPDMNLDAQAVTEKIWTREQVQSTALGNGLAIPHIRIPSLKQICVIPGRSMRGIDFNAPDDEPVRLIFLILTPEDNPVGHLEVFADISRLFRKAEMVNAALDVQNYTEFLALIKASSPNGNSHGLSKIAT